MTATRIVALVAFLLPGATACGGDGPDTSLAAQDGRIATAHAGDRDWLTAEELEAGRVDRGWREWVEGNVVGSQQRAGADSAAAPGSSSAAAAESGQGTAASRPRPRPVGPPQSWDAISMQTANSGAIALPVGGDDAEGPGVLRVQVLLDRAAFSPGIIDGYWGANTEKAVYWLQRREGLEPTGEVDETTWHRLAQLSGEPQQIVRTHRLTEDDVAGPFVDLPEEWYDRRDLDCQCYESLAEKLAERFHTSEALLEQLNPDTDLNALQAGATLNVPNVGDRMAPQGAAGDVARIVISDGGRYLHALDGDGRLLYHFPATLGAAYSPSPEGEYHITGIAHDPEWHYQPDLLHGVDDDEPDAILPAGPNNAVGTVWMALSRPHYGIHGTAAPETIGYAVSNGCVRLTNWDVEFLAERVAQGTQVEFRDIAR
ncbi:MAG TPA: L,D-transpeptidase family protein [Longimicrobiales bacterium]|nr:L,D-transpeptidase family protein [Longimicrobiales bacterium]